MYSRLHILWPEFRVLAFLEAAFWGGCPEVWGSVSGVGPDNASWVSDVSVEQSEAEGALFWHTLVFVCGAHLGRDLTKVGWDFFPSDGLQVGI